MHISASMASAEYVSVNVLIRARFRELEKQAGKSLISKMQEVIRIFISLLSMVRTRTTRSSPESREYQSPDFVFMQIRKTFPRFLAVSELL